MKGRAWEVNCFNYKVELLEKDKFLLWIHKSTGTDASVSVQDNQNCLQVASTGHPGGDLRRTKRWFHIRKWVSALALLKFWTSKVQKLKIDYCKEYKPFSNSYFPILFSSLKPFLSKVLCTPSTINKHLQGCLGSTEQLSTLLPRISLSTKEKTGSIQPSA